MNEPNSPDPDPTVHQPEASPWSEPPRVISDEEFERSQRLRRRCDLRYEAEMPRAAVTWWRFRTIMLGGKPAYFEAAPSGHASWDHVYDKVRTAITGRAERDTGLMIGLVGYHGSGKTVLATGLLLLVTSQLQSARYTTLFDLALKLEAALASRGETSREEVIAEYRKPRLLVIDDCSASAASEAESRCLRGILDHRYYQKRDTILISNDSPEGFTEFVGEAIANRARQGGGFLECNWECFRK